VRTPYFFIPVQTGAGFGVWVQAQLFKFQRGMVRHAKIHSLGSVSTSDYHDVVC
jgi:hypothetical protein